MWFLGGGRHPNRLRRSWGSDPRSECFKWTHGCNFLDFCPQNQGLLCKNVHFLKKMIPDETPGKTTRLKMMAYGSSNYEVFSENIDLTCNFQSNHGF